MRKEKIGLCHQQEVRSDRDYGLKRPKKHTDKEKKILDIVPILADSRTNQVE